MAIQGLETWELNPAFPRVEEALLELCGEFEERPVDSKLDKAFSMVTEERSAMVDLSVASALGHRALISDTRTSRRHFIRPGRIQLRRDITCRVDYPQTFEQFALLSEPRKAESRTGHGAAGTLLAERPETAYVEYRLGPFEEDVWIARNGLIGGRNSVMNISGLAGVLETIIEDSRS